MRFRRGCRGWGLALAALAIDRISKAFVMRMNLGEILEVIPGILNFRYTRNHGAAFGFWGEHRVFLIVVALLVCAAVLAVLFRFEKMPRPMRAGLWLIFAGGLGNVFDRIAYGFVVDFLDLAFFNFPIFNLADTCITIGAILAGGSLLFSDMGEKRRHG